MARTDPPSKTKESDNFCSERIIERQAWLSDQIGTRAFVRRTRYNSVNAKRCGERRRVADRINDLMLMAITHIQELARARAVRGKRSCLALFSWIKSMPIGPSGQMVSKFTRMASFYETRDLLRPLIAIFATPWMPFTPERTANKPPLHFAHGEIRFRFDAIGNVFALRGICFLWTEFFSILQFHGGNFNEILIGRSSDALAYRSSLNEK